MILGPGGLFTATSGALPSLKPVRFVAENLSNHLLDFEVDRSALDRFLGHCSRTMSTSSLTCRLYFAPGSLASASPERYLKSASILKKCLFGLFICVVAWQWSALRLPDDDRGTYTILRVQTSSARRSLLFVRPSLDLLWLYQLSGLQTRR